MTERKHQITMAGTKEFGTIPVDIPKLADNTPFHRLLVGIPELSTKKTFRIYDLGVGNGRTLCSWIRAVNQGPYPRTDLEITGVELQPELTAKASRLFGNEAEIIQRDLNENISIPSGQDLITSSWMLHWLEPNVIPQVIANSHEALNDGGILAIAMLNPTDVAAVNRTARDKQTLQRLYPDETIHTTKDVFGNLVYQVSFRDEALEATNSAGYYVAYHPQGTILGNDSGRTLTAYTGEYLRETLLNAGFADVDTWEEFNPQFPSPHGDPGYTFAFAQK